VLTNFQNFGSWKCKTAIFLHSSFAFPCNKETFLLYNHSLPNIIAKLIFCSRALLGTARCSVSIVTNPFFCECRVQCPCGERCCCVISLLKASGDGARRLALASSARRAESAFDLRHSKVHAHGAEPGSFISRPSAATNDDVVALDSQPSNQPTSEATDSAHIYTASVFFFLHCWCARWGKTTSQGERLVSSEHSTFAAHTGIAIKLSVEASERAGKRHTTHTSIANDDASCFRSCFGLSYSLCCGYTKRIRSHLLGRSYLIM
jgi:hypothetical protein